MTNTPPNETITQEIILNIVGDSEKAKAVWLAITKDIRFCHWHDDGITELRQQTERILGDDIPLGESYFRLAADILSDIPAR